MTRPAAMPRVVISVCRDRTAARALAHFFVRSVDTAYISHGEMQGGRAEGPTRWRHDLLAEVTTEFVRLASARGATAATAQLVEASRDGEPVGVAVVAFHRGRPRPYAVLEDLVVARDARGSGIGKALLSWIERAARSAGIRDMYLESGIHNEGAHRFFERSRYRIVSKVMHKRLRG